MNKNDVAGLFSRLCADGPAQTLSDKLALAEAAIDLLRRLDWGGGKTDPLQALIELASLPLHRIPTSVTATLESDARALLPMLDIPEQHADMVLFSALCDFLSSLSDEQASADPEDLIATVALEADRCRKLLNKPTAKPVKQAHAFPTVCNSLALNHVFAAPRLQPADLELIQCSLLSYRHTHPATQALLPAQRGVAVYDEQAELYRALLETGEVVWIDKEDPNVTWCNTPEDYAVLSPILPAYLFAGVAQLTAELVDEAAVVALLESERLGKTRRPFHHVNLVDQNQRLQIAELDRLLFDIPKKDATLEHHVRIPVDGTDLVVVLSAQPNTFCYSVFSRLVRVDDAGNEVVLMRQETPRQISAAGVYLFPTETQCISLIV